VSDTGDKRLDLLLAMTPSLAADGWRSIETAPHDGTEIQIRLVHMLAAFSDDPKEDGYIATARARWIDHNGGGFTWHGLAGIPAQWRPLGIPFHDLAYVDPQAYNQFI